MSSYAVADAIDRGPMPLALYLVEALSNASSDHVLDKRSRARKAVTVSEGIGYIPLMERLQDTFVARSMQPPCRRAVRGGHLGAIKWLVERMHQRDYITDDGHSRSHRACLTRLGRGRQPRSGQGSGRRGVVASKPLTSSDRKDVSRDAINQMVAMAMRCGQDHVAEWLQSLGYEIMDQERLGNGTDTPDRAVWSRGVHSHDQGHPTCGRDRAVYLVGP